MTLHLLVALLATAAIVPGQRAQLAPQATAKPKGLAYYPMSGNVIVGPAYADPNACMKAVANVKKTLPPGSPPIVCAYRSP
jgi:hypothetical protein